MKNTLKTKLRIRFVLFAVLGIFLLLAGIVFVSIHQNFRDMTEKSDLIISGLYRNPSEHIRYFSVKIPAGKSEIYPDVMQYSSITGDQVRSLSREALERGEEKGYLDGFRYHVYQNENGSRIYFLSRHSSIEMCKTAAQNLILISVLGLLGVALLLIPISGLVVAPLLENDRKQRAFITSAGHELKTPLTVISTNVQMLSMEIGENEWLAGIQKQITHLTKLTHDFATLSKIEEYTNPVVRESFSFSDLLEDAVETYTYIAHQRSVKIECAPLTQLEYVGSKAEIRQLLHILLDNACKYSTKNSVIRIDFKKTIQGLHLSVANPTKLLKEEKAKLFVQRFHRGSNAEKESGFGLGLSIAEAIALRHHGHLSVSTDTKGEFRVEVVLR